MTVRLLLVEDSATIAECTADVIREASAAAGIAVTVDYAVTVKSASKAARLASYDVILMDMLLDSRPGLCGGLRATARIRLFGKSKHALIIGYSALYDDTEFVTRAHRLGIDYFIPKACATEDIVRLLREAEGVATAKPPAT